MAKSQKKTNKEVRKPKAEKPKKQNASNPSQKVRLLQNLDWHGSKVLAYLRV